MLPSLLREDSILLHLEAPNREAALAELIASLPVASFPNRHKASLLEVVLQRELFGTTAVGDQIALPHCFSNEVSEMVISLGISRKGIAFPSLDGQPVHLVLLTIFPESYRGNRLKADFLKEAETIFRDRFLRERLKIAETVEEAYEIFIREAEHLTGVIASGLKNTA
jgi:mannitol/fructose-specific phosphotransferase system IIA component (Ntr-type)